MKAPIAVTLLLALIAPLAAKAEQLMYVPTGGANDLVVINLNTDRIINRIPELQNAHGLAASPDSEYLVAGSMQIMDAGASAQEVKPEAVSEAEHEAHHAPGEIAPSGNTSYVSIVHPEHGHVMRRIAVRGLTHHTAISPNGKYAIAVHSGAGGISVINLERMAVEKEVETGRSPNYAIFSEDGKRLFVSNAFSNTVSEIDTQNWTITRTFNVDKEPEHMALSADGGKLFVASVGDGQIVELALTTGTVINRFHVGARPHGVSVSADGRWLFASSQGDGKLMRVDLATGKQRLIDLQPAPYHLEYVDGVNKLYVSSRKEPIIWVIDPTSLKTLHTINIGKGVAHQMVILEQPGR